MTAREWVDMVADEAEEAIIVADGYDNAIIGIGRQPDGVPVVVYDRAKVIGIIRSMQENPEADDAWESAEEHFEFNVVRSLPYVGAGAPMFVELPPGDE